MSHILPREDDYFIGVLAASVLWGISLSLFCVAMAGAKGRFRYTRWIYVGTVILFLLCSAHFFATLQHTYAYVVADHYAWIKYYDVTTGPLGLAAALANFTGDLILTYRLWIIYRDTRVQNWILLLPLLCSVGGAACGVVMAVGQLPVFAVEFPDGSDNFDRIIVAGYILPLATNMMVTIFIVARIYWLSTRLLGEDSSISPRIQRSIAVVVESGGLYTVFQIVYVALQLVGKHTGTAPGYSILGMVTPQIYGIAPTLITAGVTLGYLSDLRSGITFLTNHENTCPPARTAIPASENIV